MNTFTVLALCLPLLADVVHTRQGKKIEGRILDYPQHVEVIPPEGKKVVIPKGDIEHIEISPNLIESPEFIPYPFDLVEKTASDYISYERTLVCLPRPPARKVVAIDIVPKVQKVWDFDLPDRVGDVVFCGRTLHLMQREEFVDDARKYKVAGAPFSKKVYRLTVTALDLVTGQTSWKLVIDNNDRKDLLWEFAPPPPALLVTPERAILRTLKIGWPMDSKGNVDKTDLRTFMTIYTFDIRTQKLVDAVDNTNMLDIRARVFLFEDQMIVITLTGAARFTLTSIDLDNGKTKWKIENITGRLLDVMGDQAYAIDQTHLYAYSLKTGKKVDNWVIQHSDGTIEAIDHSYVYYYRRKEEPRAIIAYDVKRAEKAFEIPIPEKDDFKHETLVGHRLLFTDRAQTLRAYDTLQKKLLWEWKGPGNGGVSRLCLLGSGLTFLKDGRINHLDLNTGRLAWAVRGSYSGIVAVGDAGLVIYKIPPGLELLRRRIAPPPGATFFNEHGTPLRFALGEDLWSVPAFAGDMMYSLTGSGTCYALDLKKNEVAWTVKVAGPGATTLPAPVAAGGQLAVFGAGSTQVYDTASKTKLHQVPDAVTTPCRPSLTDRGLLTLTGGSLALSEAATGKRIWVSKARPVRDFILANKRAYAITPTEIHMIDLASGETDDAAPLPANTAHLAVDGKRLFAAVGSQVVGETWPAEKFIEFFRSAPQDPRAPMRFRGSLAASGGKVYFSHAAGEVACFDADAKDESKRTLWSFPAPQFTSPLLLHEGRLWFAAPGKGLFGLNAGNGSVEWKAEVSDAAAFTPFFYQGKPAFWSNEGWIIKPE